MSPRKGRCNDDEVIGAERQVGRRAGGQRGQAGAPQHEAMSCRGQDGGRHTQALHSDSSKIGCKLTGPHCVFTTFPLRDLGHVAEPLGTQFLQL